jgi:hypothetical protein
MGPLTGIPAIICGHVARGRIARSGGTLGGGGQALGGLLMGYVSVFIFVVVVAIFVRTTSGFQSKLAKPSVTAQQSRLTDALVAYKADFGKFPAIASSSGEEVDTKRLVDILGGQNEKGRKYYEASGNGFHLNGVPADPWFQTLYVAVDLDGDGSVKVGNSLVPGVCAVWSSGPNKSNEHGGGDDIVSW